VFRAPWEAQVFALTLALHERGCFSWKEWTDRLAAEIAAAAEAGGPDDGADYYDRWLSALEGLASDKGLLGIDELAVRKAAWDRAARATPHGQPIELPGRAPR
jgi:nitrile hydratase accessory protein